MWFSMIYVFLVIITMIFALTIIMKWDWKESKGSKYFDSVSDPPRLRYLILSVS